MNNTNALVDWLSNQNNLNTVSVIQQGVSLLVGLLIFIKSYDFSAMFASVRKRRAEAKRQKEMKKLEKFKKLLELAKSHFDGSQNGDVVDISKIAMSNEEEDDDDTEEKVPDSVIKMARKKSRREVV